MLWLLDALGAIAVRTSDVLIAVLAVVGLGLLLSTWFGRARGLIVLGLLLVPVVAVSAAADRIDFRGGIGERNWSPQSSVQLRDQYRLGAGLLQLDLTRLDPSTLDSEDPVLHTELSLGAGQVQLIVPETWSIDAVSTVDMGTVWSYSGGMAVGEDDPTLRSGNGEWRFDFIGTQDYYFPRSEELPNSGGDAQNVHTLEVRGKSGAPELDIDMEVTAGEVEVFRVAP